MSDPKLVFDREAALVHLDGDVDLLREGAVIFLEDTPKLVDAVREAIGRKEPEALMRAAHTLKGSAANFAANETVVAAYRLERMGRERNLENVEDAFEQLQRALDPLRAALAALAEE